MSDLTVHACWALLRDSVVGRLAVVVDDRPDIFPVNFVGDHGSIVIRTGPGTKLAAAAQGVSVAFDADGYDAAAGEAWSVVVKGQVELVQTIQTWRTSSGCRCSLGMQSPGRATSASFPVP